MIYHKQRVEKKCPVCGYIFLGKQKQIYCSIKCRTDKILKDNQVGPEFRILTNGTKGALNEFIVIVDLLKKGYEVFRAVSQDSSCDLAILKDKKLLRVEVTSAWTSAGGKIIRSKKKITSGKNDILATIYHGDKIDYFPNTP